MDNKCFHYQPEQLPIDTILEALEMTDIMKKLPRTAAIITYSKLHLNSIKFVNNHSYVIEDIRVRLPKLERST